MIISWRGLLPTNTRNRLFRLYHWPSRRATTAGLQGSFHLPILPAKLKDAWATSGCLEATKPCFENLYIIYGCSFKIFFKQKFKQNSRIQTYVSKGQNILDDLKATYMVSISQKGSPANFLSICRRYLRYIPKSLDKNIPFF